ncbi:MAG TPA: FAD-binding oxidoreductase [Actinomycetes bacterium]|nr:FAD-binding oxidoreductase [Actinomycetes bacterium]
MTTSLWWDTLPPELSGPRRAALDGDREADVAIVGAGFTGLWTAYHLLRQRPGLDVVVLEREVAGFGASGRNGGWCSALFPSSWAKVARTSSRDAAIALQRGLFETVDEIGTIVAEEGIDCHWAKGGTYVLARTPVQLERARAHVAEARTFGFGPEDYRFLDAREARAGVGASDVLGATYTPHCAAIHPARLVRGLALAVERRGGRIHEATTVRSVEPGVVRTVSGHVRARHVIRATEGYTPTLTGHKRTLAPVYSLMLATEPLPASFWEQAGLRERATFADERHLIIYGQRTADGRIAFGGRGAPYHYGSRISPAFDSNPRVFDELRRVLWDVFPGLGDVDVTHRWGGPLGVPRDWYASVGLDPTTGLGWAGGYVGDGVGASHLAGRTLADLVLGEDTPRTGLPWVGHHSRPWEPEPLRWLGANAGLRVMTAADHEEARTGRPSRLAAAFGRFIGQ